MVNLEKMRRSSLNPLVSKARASFIRHLGRYENLKNPPVILVACSGGPDSLALASIAGFYHRRGDIRAGAIVLDHGLQPATAAVAEKTIDTLKAIGLDPVVFRKINVENTGGGLEATARAARYHAFMDIGRHYGAAAILTGHHADDQAEQVLLGLARGSGTGSLSGIAPRRVLAERNGNIYYLDDDAPGAERRPGLDPAKSGYTVDVVRPFLSLPKAHLREICRLEGLDYWEDPSNYDASNVRSKIRTQILPYLTAALDPGVPQALSRTAAISRSDETFMRRQAATAFRSLAEAGKGAGDDALIVFDIAALRILPEAVRLRVYKEAAASAAAGDRSADGLGRQFSEPLTWERSYAIDRLVFQEANNKKVQTPAPQPYAYVQWLKQSGSSAQACRKAEGFFSGYGRWYYDSCGCSGVLSGKNTSRFSSLGKYGTLVVQVKST